MTVCMAARRVVLAVLVTVAIGAGCVREEGTAGGPADAAAAAVTDRRPRVRRRRPPPVSEPAPVPPVPVTDDAIGSKSLDDINRDSPLKPLFYGLDQSEVDAAGQQVLQANADVLKKYASWQITVEGHCDERGTAEYNLALGERRAVAARNYLVSLGIAADRIKTVSYGKEFPFDPAHTEAAWAKNRRAHFVVTAK